VVLQRRFAATAAIGGKEAQDNVQAMIAALSIVLAQVEAALRGAV
jgi:hypothetical protein